MGNIKPYDYLFLSTRVRSLEGQLLTGERMERMLEASSQEAALEVLLECGYPALPAEPGAIDAALAQQRQAVLEDIRAFAPDPRVVDIFRLRYDYHNVKVLLKAEAVGAEPGRLLLPTGRISVQTLQERVRSGELTGLPPVLAEAIQEAREVLGTTQNPQRADFVLDRAYYRDMDQLARETGSEFLRGYVGICVDAANLRAVVRTLRMGKGVEFLQGALVPGGSLDPARLRNAVEGGGLEELYTASLLREAAEEAEDVLAGGAMTRFERACDNAVTAYLSKAKYIAFGDGPVAAYLAAKESEWTAIRVIMSGRAAGLNADTIRERLREAYV